MRGDRVYRIYGIHQGRDQDTYFGAFRTVAEAEAEVEKLRAREMLGRNWAAQYQNRGFEIREAIVETDFELPSLPKPRDRYVVKGTPKPNGGTIVEVFHRARGSGLEKICEYERNYELLRTFEPFRQGDRELALISRDYSRTAVLDLSSGQVVAEEPAEGGNSFCPVGFYVPDWWDVNDGSVIPGSQYWTPDYEWPAGDFGFVWGCYWGDDSSWKVQYLDLSGVRDGVVRRDERFGYVELATSKYVNPCFTTDEPSAERNSGRPPFITLWRSGGVSRVRFAVEMEFDLASGGPADWQRLRIGHFE